jgi:hypothetical protein
MQISLRNQKVVRDYDRINKDRIHSMATTTDNKHIFVGCHNKLKQFKVDDHKLAKVYAFDQ